MKGIQGRSHLSRIQTCLCDIQPSEKAPINPIKTTRCSGSMGAVKNNWFHFAYSHKTRNTNPGIIFSRINRSLLILTSGNLWHNRIWKAFMIICYCHYYLKLQIVYTVFHPLWPLLYVMVSLSHDGAWLSHMAMCDFLSLYWYLGFRKTQE